MKMYFSLIDVFNALTLVRAASDFDQRSKTNWCLKWNQNKPRAKNGKLLHENGKLEYIKFKA